MEFARKAHGNQQRKYSEDLYIAHPIRVAELVKTVDHTQEMICAAYLHDVVEDTGVSLQDIKRRFGLKISRLVEELTDKFEIKNYPHLNRRQRKKLEVERQARMSREAKTIKLADVIDNTRDIVKNDPGFARKYLIEMEALIGAIREGDLRLLQLACYEVQKGKIHLELSSKN